MSDHLFELEKYSGPSSRYKCPSCGNNKDLARYINKETGEHLADNVGRCNRESSCGYHYTPSDYFKNEGKGLAAQTNYARVVEAIPVKPVDFIEQELFEKSFNGMMETNFAKFLSSLVGPTVAKETLLKYFVGRSRFDNSTASIFWRVNVDQNIMNGKAVAYTPETGKRKKDVSMFAISGVINKQRREQGLEELNLQQCFFGEHLLTDDTTKPLAVVESEKSAIIASLYLPQYTWIATGGASGCKWREYNVYKVLKNRTVIFFPDFGYYSRPQSKPQSEWVTCFNEWTKRVNHISETLPGSFRVSDLLEKKLPQDQRISDLDIVDLILKRDEQTGHALTAIEQGGYPLMFDLK